MTRRAERENGIERRSFLATLAIAGTSCARTMTGPSASGTPRATTAPSAADNEARTRRTVELLDWTFPTELGGPKRCTVLVPHPIAPGEKHPILVALHGLGETTDPVTGANGWPKSYELQRTYERLLNPPLEPEAFQGLVTSERLSEVNASLAATPFVGPIVACPYLPKDIGGGTPIELYAQWLGERLLPRLRSELAGDERLAATGIDGVSLGGWTALRIAMMRPEMFGVVGALQPAIGDMAQVDWAMSLITTKLGNRPLRIVTSTEDLYRPTLVELDRRLTEKGIAHEFAITPGPHDYPWNKGPGGIEMLTWHDRMLRR